MKIGFVADPYEEKNASGMGFVVSELLKHLLIEGTQHEFVVYASRPVSKTFIPGEYRVVEMPKGFLQKMWFFWRGPLEVDALLFVAPFLPLIPRRGVRSVMICQELGSQKIKPEGVRDTLFAFFRDRILMPISLRRAEVVAAASHATRNDILTFYSVDPAKAVVIYDGYQDLTLYAKDAPTTPAEYVPYFFFVGKVKYRKNVHGIAEAFVQFKKRTNAPVHLVLAGDYGGPYYERIMEVLTAGGVEKDVHFIGYLNGRAELYAYYKHALAVVFPSINEGFGMPIIEAMSIGTPVITSNISSMAEAAGDAGLLVDPHSSASIAEAMEKMYSDESVRTAYVARGYVRAKNFSWTKAAHEFLATLS